MIHSDSTKLDGLLLQELLAASASGDRIAFSQFYDMTRRKLFGIALSVTKRSDLAEEVLQDAYIKIWRRSGDYDPAKSSPITWSITIVRNQAIDVVRRRDVASECDGTDILHVPDDQESALDSLQMSDNRGHALIALRGLNPLQRSLIVAAYVHGESREQLALRFGRPVSTIKTWLRRAILQARTSMEASAGEQTAA